MLPRVWRGAKRASIWTFGNREMRSRSAGAASKNPTAMVVRRQRPRLQLPRRWTAVAVALAISLGGCANPGQNENSGSESPSPAATSRGPLLGDLTRSVLAVFEEHESGDYAIYVSARYDIPLHSIGVIAHGEFEGNGASMYYAAVGSVDAEHAGLGIALTIDDSLAQASLRATVEIRTCTNEEGQLVADNRCPIGQLVQVEISWKSGSDIEQLGPSNPAGIHPGKGRKATASGQIGSSLYAASIYALIVESQTYQE
jgi:hypothetical protein